MTLNSGICGSTFPSHETPRMIAGGPIANDVLKCALKPVDPSGITTASSIAGQLAELESIFRPKFDGKNPGRADHKSTRTHGARRPGRADKRSLNHDLFVAAAIECPGHGRLRVLVKRDRFAQFEVPPDDGGNTAGYEDCASPMRYGPLRGRPHTFSVRATDAAGNTGGPATVKFRTGGPAPVLAISSAVFASGPINVGGELQESRVNSRSAIPGSDPVNLDDFGTPHRTRRRFLQAPAQRQHLLLPSSRPGFLPPEEVPPTARGDLRPRK